jgi:hypothetical protein
MKKTIIGFLFISLFILLGSLPTTVSALSPVYPPEWQKCTDDGGTLFSSQGSQYSYNSCRFPDGKICDVWEYSKGTCTPFKVNSLNDLHTTCVSAFDGCNSCARISGDQWACTAMWCENPTQAYCKKFEITSPEPLNCTAVYEPVCGDTGLLRCVTAPCIGVYKTYGNTCEMTNSGATFVYDGECKLISQKPSFCNASYIKLMYGTRGDSVRALQEYLQIHGYNPGIIDGIFGPKVAGAVKLFQGSTNLKIDGIFGKDSRAKACAMF